jgi:hypothetical protein
MNIRSYDAFGDASRAHSRRPFSHTHDTEVTRAAWSDWAGRSRDESGRGAAARAVVCAARAGGAVRRGLCKAKGSESPTERRAQGSGHERNGKSSSEVNGKVGLARGMIQDARAQRAFL